MIDNKKRLDKAFNRGEVIYYLDECMFTVKTFMTTDWAPKKMNVTVKSSEFNTQSTAFLGAIREGHGMFYYKMYDRAVDAHHFTLYLQQLRKRHGDGRFILYMDSLPVHKSKVVMKEMEALDIEPMWAPIYSPQYNPIEMVFSQLKAGAKRLRLQDMLK